MEKILLSAALLFFIVGCVQQGDSGQTCAQVITYALSPSGDCMEFPTPCDVPENYNLVQSCEGRANLCAGVNCADKCIGNNYYSNGTCKEGSCSYASEVENDSRCLSGLEGKYQFDANNTFCTYDKFNKKFVLVYQIRNHTNNIPPLKSTIWLKAMDLNEAYVKTIQDEYRKDLIIWNDVKFSYEGKIYRGQSWEIQNRDTNSPVDFKLIFCEPQFSEKDQCTEENGVVIAQENTSRICN